MKKRYLLPLLTAGLFGMSCSNKTYKQAEKHYTVYEYAIASKLYDTHLVSHPDDHQAMLRLADCYRMMNQHSTAESWYEKAINSPEATKEDKLHYAQVLKENGKYSEAQKWFDAFLAAAPGNKAALNQRSSCDSADLFARPDVFYTIAPVQVNTAGSVFSPVMFGDKMLVTAEAPVKSEDHARTRTGHGFLNLYTTSPGDPANLAPLEGEVNSNLHEGPAVFSADGKQLFFTRSFFLGKNAAKAEDNDNHLEICLATKGSDGKWGNIVSLPFNSKEYSCGHPAITGDGKRLFFVSDMPGGFGATDIYYSDFDGSTWSKPVNAGASINTEGEEMFPAVHRMKNGKEEFFYSTDGLPGAGGLDLFRCKMDGALPSDPVRMSAPFNSSADDFGIVFSPDDRSGFFTSNREMTDGSDKLFRFQRRDPNFFVKAVILDKASREPLVNTSIEVKNLTAEKNRFINTDNNGAIIFPSDSMTDYEFCVHQTEYFACFGGTTVKGFRGSFSDTTYVTLMPEKIVINKPIRLENIYYDYNKWNIRPDAAIELDKLVKIMVDNPQIKIELSSHTDCRGSDSFNERLSQKRAVSAVDYIISKGVSKDRITAKGYGEKQLLNKCDDGVKCTEEEHQWNRRTEFKVTQILQVPNPI